MVDLSILRQKVCGLIDRAEKHWKHRSSDIALPTRMEISESHRELREQRINVNTETRSLQKQEENRDTNLRKPSLWHFFWESVPWKSPNLYSQRSDCFQYPQFYLSWARSLQIFQKQNRHFGYLECFDFGCQSFQLDSDPKWPDCPHMPGVPVFGSVRHKSATPDNS